MKTNSNWQWWLLFAQTMSACDQQFPVACPGGLGAAEELVNGNEE